MGEELEPMFVFILSSFSFLPFFLSSSFLEAKTENPT